MTDIEDEFPMPMQDLQERVNAVLEELEGIIRDDETLHQRSLDLPDREGWSGDLTKVSPREDTIGDMIQKYLRLAADDLRLVLKAYRRCLDENNPQANGE